MNGALKVALRTGILVAVAGGSAIAIRQVRHQHATLDLPFTTAHKGEFLVLIRCRGELVADRSRMLIAPRDVPELQIIWLAPPGSVVKAGQPVIRFDPSRTRQDIQDKQTALKQAEAALAEAVAQARITADQDQVDLSAAKYAVEKARLEASKQAIVSAIQGEESAIDLSLAEEKLKVLQAAIEVHRHSAQAKIDSLRRSRDTVKSQMELSQHQLALLELQSPLNGVINYLPNYSQGWMNAQPFKVGDHSVPGGALAEIPDLSTLEMESKVEETDRGRISVNDEVLIHVDAFPEKAVHGRLVSITPLTEQSFNEWPPTRSFRAFAQLEKPDPRMRPGMNAGADLIEKRIPDAVSIPAKALFTRNGKPAVYVRAPDRYEPREVRVKARNPDEVAIEGIPAGTAVALAEPALDKTW